VKLNCWRWGIWESTFVRIEDALALDGLLRVELLILETMEVERRENRKEREEDELEMGREGECKRN